MKVGRRRSREEEVAQVEKGGKDGMRKREMRGKRPREVFDPL